MVVFGGFEKQKLTGQLSGSQENINIDLLIHCI